MRQKIEALATILITLSSVFVAGLVAFRSFSAPPPRPSTVQNTTTKVANWNQLLKAGRLMGSESAKVTILEFADFECPFCRRFSESVRAVRAQYGGDVAHVFIHYPLGSHRFALPAARIAECSFLQGRFESMHDLLLQKQDSLGLKDWQSFAEEAGIPDLKAFASCSKGTATVPMIDKGLAAGRTVGVDGTPTVIVNGLLYSRPPYDSLSEIVRRIVTAR